MKKKTIIIGIVLLSLLLIGSLTIFFLLNQNKLISKIESIDLEYVPGMNYQKANELNQASENNKIEIQKISLTKNNKIIGLMKKVSEKTEKKEFETVYKITINKDTELLIGEKIGNLKVNKKDTYVKIPSSLLKELKNSIQKNNSKILDKIPFEKFVIKKDGAVITLSNKDNIEIVTQALPHYKIALEENYSTYDGGYKMLVDLDNTTRIYLYSSNIGYVKKQDEAYYAIFPYELNNAVESIYNKSV